MCAREHQVNKHQCGVIGCNKGKGKLCIHVVARCANCNGNHQANSARCPSRQKAEIQAQKKKPAKEVTPKASPEPKVNPEFEVSPSLDKASPGPDEVSPDPDMGMDLSPEWAEYKEEAGSDHDEIPEGINHSKKY